MLVDMPDTKALKIKMRGDDKDDSGDGNSRDCECCNCRNLNSELISKIIIIAVFHGGTIKIG